MCVFECACLVADEGCVVGAYGGVVDIVDTHDDDVLGMAGGVGP